MPGDERAVFKGDKSVVAVQTAAVFRQKKRFRLADVFRPKRGGMYRSENDWRQILNQVGRLSRMMDDYYMDGTFVVLEQYDVLRSQMADTVHRNLAGSLMLEDSARQVFSGEVFNAVMETDSPFRICYRNNLNEILDRFFEYMESMYTGDGEPEDSPYIRTKIPDEQMKLVIDECLSRYIPEAFHPGINGRSVILTEGVLDCNDILFVMERAKGLKRTYSPVSADVVALAVTAPVTLESPVRKRLRTGSHAYSHAACEE